MATQFANITLQDTWDAWRIRYNLVQKQMNNILGANGVVDFTANTINVKHKIDGSNLKIYANTLIVDSNANFNGTVSFVNSTPVFPQSSSFTNISGSKINITGRGNFDSGITTSGNSIFNGHLNFANTSGLEVGAVTKLKIDGGSAGQFLKTDGSGNLSWITPTNNAVTTGTTGNSIPRLNTKNFWSATQQITPRINLTLTDASANPGPYFDLYRISSTPADNDQLGVMRFLGRNSINSNVVMASISTKVSDVTSTQEETGITLNVRQSGSLNELAIANSSGFHIANGDFQKKLSTGYYPARVFYEIEKKTISTVANTRFETIPTETNLMEYTFDNITMSNDSEEIEMRVKVGGVWQDTAGDYEYVGHAIKENTASDEYNDSSADSIVLVDNGANLGLGNDTNEKLSGYVRIYTPLDSSFHKTVQWYFTYENSLGRIQGVEGHAVYKGSTTAIQGVEFLTSTGTMSGTITQLARE